MISPECCTFVTGHVLDDGEGGHGWGVVAFQTGATVQGTPVGYLLGFQSSTPTHRTRLDAGALERVGNVLYHLGMSMAPTPDVAMAAIDVSDATDMSLLWSDAAVDFEADVPVYLRAHPGGQGSPPLLYVWTNTSATGCWNCTIWSLADPHAPARGDRLSWEVPWVDATRGREHYAVSRGALYFLNPVSWRIEVYDCQDFEAAVQVAELELPAQMHPAARLAAGDGTAGADDNRLAVGVRHFRDGEWLSSLIVYDIAADPFTPEELWRLEEPAETDEPTWQPIGIVEARPTGGAQVPALHLFYTDESHRVSALDMETRETVAVSTDLPGSLHVLDWDVRGGLLFRKVASTPGFMLPSALYEGVNAAAVERLPVRWPFTHRGYGWWPDGWTGTPEDLGHEIVVMGPGIVGGMALPGGGVSMFTDPKGVAWAAIVGWNSIYILRRTGGPTEWTTWAEDEKPGPDNIIELPESSGYDAVDITGDGEVIIVLARSAAGRHTYEWYSIDGGTIWLGPYALTEM